MSQTASSAQIGMIHAQFGKLGVYSSVEKLETVEEVLGPNVQIAELEDLTKAEATELIKYLIQENGEVERDDWIPT